MNDNDGHCRKNILALAEKQFKVQRFDHNYSIACQKQSLLI